MDQLNARVDAIRDRIESHEVGPLQDYRQYAVLLPLVDIDGELSLLYEVRSLTISQPGDTSFPGGRVEPGERFLEAAIRETVEELNVKEDQITILGEVDYIIGFNRVIGCFAGVLDIASLDELEINDEVDHVFTVPLRYLLDNPPIVYETQVTQQFPDDFPFERIYQGDKYPFRVPAHRIAFYDLPGDDQLWGMTASVTQKFIEMIADLID